MKKIILALAVFVLIATPVFAATYVKGYTKSDGTYVSGHYRSTPDKSYNNNYSVKGNYNPNTGKIGTKKRTWTDKSPTYNKKHYGTKATYNY
jgi:hypothetical protein